MYSWSWPLDGNRSLKEWLKKFPTPEGCKELRDEFLNSLAASPLLPIDEKKRLLDSRITTSPARMTEWLETSRQASPSSDTTLPESLFQAQLAWAQYLLGDEPGREAFLLWPLRDRHCFPEWETLPHYWHWLASTLEKRPSQAKAAAMAREKALDPLRKPAWEAFTRLESDPEADTAQAASVLEAILAFPLPNDRKACLNLCAWYLDSWPEGVNRLQPVVDHLLQLAPEWDNAHHIHGGFLARIGRFQEAKAAFDKGLTCNNRNARLLNSLGSLLHVHLGQFREAEACYRKALRIDPLSAELWNNLGNLLHRALGRFEEAETAYREAIAIDAGFAEAWNGLGYLLTNHLARYTEAEAAYRKAAELAPHASFPWNGLGNLLISQLARPEEAESAFRNAIRIDDADATPWNGLGSLQGEYRRQCQQALQSFDRGVALESTEAYLRFNRGHLRLQLGQSGWREDLQTALEGFETEPELSGLVNRLWLAVELNLPERLPGEKAIEEAVALWKGEAELHGLIALRNLALSEPMQPALERSAAVLRSHTSHRLLLAVWSYVAGARPDLREEARKAAAFFFNLGPEVPARFQDVPQPELVERYRDFVEGRTDGAGDPRDLRNFCCDADDILKSEM
ncbi:MAG: tetratricopeptide repeat protein [Magnetococcales bacterium]|nr:tetratricopeptide repeat protein [Magnetococcales bacterium]